MSWVRHRDIHILTAGAYTYTSDLRFQALHKQTSGQNSEWTEWTLCIKWAQERDQGIYECQISTIPVKSHQFYLNVVGSYPKITMDISFKLFPLYIFNYFTNSEENILTFICNQFSYNVHRYDEKI